MGHQIWVSQHILLQIRLCDLRVAAPTITMPLPHKQVMIPGLELFTALESFDQVSHNNT